MKIEELGEKAFLSALLPQLVTKSNFVNGFGHDASIIDLGLDDIAIAMKIDRAGKPVAAINGWTDYRLWGRLAVTANCSDILAIGATPKGFMLSISVPRTWESSVVEEIVFGAQQECEINGVTFLGGDTKESTEPQVVGAAIGTVCSEYYLNRKIASKGDYLVLAGSLGGFVGGYLQAKDNTKRTKKCIEYMAFPRARWKEADLINQERLAIGGMDLSDGLYDALQAIVATGNGAVIDINALPFHSLAIESSEIYSIPLFNLAFSVGDWAMLYAVSPSKIDALLSLAGNTSAELTVIGRVTDMEGIYGKDKSNEVYRIDGIVNENFRSRMEDQGSFFDSIRNKVSLIKVSDDDTKLHVHGVL